MPSTSKRKQDRGTVVAMADSRARIRVAYMLAWQAGATCVFAPEEEPAESPLDKAIERAKTAGYKAGREAHLLATQNSNYFASSTVL